MSNLISEIEEFNNFSKPIFESVDEDKRVIRCRKCYEMTYLVDMRETSPIRGRAFSNRIGCGSWTLPGKNDKGRDILCPHGMQTDLHLMLYVDEDGESDTVMLENYQLVELRSRYCDCGCGKEVKKGKNFAEGLKCYNRMRQQQAKEK